MTQFTHINFSSSWCDFLTIIKLEILFALAVTAAVLMKIELFIYKCTCCSLTGSNISALFHPSISFDLSDIVMWSLIHSMNLFRHWKQIDVRDLFCSFTFTIIPILSRMWRQTSEHRQFSLYAQQVSPVSCRWDCVKDM